MVVHNPNNWHWVDKNCLPWSEKYLEEKVSNTVVESETLRFTVTGLSSVSGDCDVTQRKGKVRCIYDMRVVFAFSVEELASEEKISGSLTVPEFVHDQDVDEYVFEIDAENYKPEVRKTLVPEVLTKLLAFQEDLIAAHEKDVQHATD